MTEISENKKAVSMEEIKITNEFLKELKNLLEKVKEVDDIIMKDEDKTVSIMIHINQGKICKPSVTIK